MYTDEQILKCHGRKSLEYLNHKNTGGRNNSRGNEYETRYALRELTIAATRYYDYGKISIFHTQIRAYVDDLLIIEENLQSHYQIKDVVKLTWGNGENSLLDNFQKQIALNKHINIASRTIIVVSNQDVYEHLKKTIPDSIKTNTDVILFQNKHIDQLIYDEPIKSGLETISSSKWPTYADLNNLLMHIYGCWSKCQSQNGISIIDFVKLLSEYKSSCVRLAPFVIDDEFKKILISIPNLEFNTEKGYFNWKFGVTDSGVIPYPCDSEQFKKLRLRILKNNPKDFNALEEFLL